MMKKRVHIFVVAVGVTVPMTIAQPGGGGGGPGGGGPGGPPPLQAPPAPAGNPLTAAKANLGKTLFWDEQLSSTRTVCKRD